MALCDAPTGDDCIRIIGRGEMDTFAGLLNKKLCVKTTNVSYMAVEYNFFIDLIGDFISRIALDEAWYLERYPDVRDAIASGAYDDPHGHYVRHGYFENRLPYRIKVDEPWYLETYDDIGQAVRSGIFENGQGHFDEVGFREGRLPHPNFVLRLRDQA